MTKKDLNKLSYGILGCAIEVHKILGPGLLESVYKECLINELKSNGYEVKIEWQVPLHYKGDKISSRLTLDLLVNDQIIIELKSVENMNPVFTAQLLTYMKLAQKPKGILINFNTEHLISGSTSLVNEFFAYLPD